MNEKSVFLLSAQSSSLSPQYFVSSVPAQSSALSPHHLFSELTAGLLRDGYRVCFRAEGKSMQPTIREGEDIIVDPVTPSDVNRGDIILYQSEKGVIAHRVVGITQSSPRNPQSSISNPRSFCRLIGDSLSSILDSRSSCLPPQSSSLSPHHLFILRGDASTSSDKAVKPQKILGKVVSVKRDGRRVELGSKGAKMLYRARLWNSRLRRAVRYLAHNKSRMDDRRYEWRSSLTSIFVL